MVCMSDNRWKWLRGCVLWFVWVTIDGADPQTQAQILAEIQARNSAGDGDNDSDWGREVYNQLPELINKKMNATENKTCANGAPYRKKSKNVPKQNFNTSERKSFKKSAPTRWQQKNKTENKNQKTVPLPEKNKNKFPHPKKKRSYEGKRFSAILVKLEWRRGEISKMTKSWEKKKNRPL